ncbi:MAG: ATP-binding protein, partial [Rectinemataceae bacterium]|nr:ATP-binding protein [Rectinemataceae bacterium]
MSIPLRHIDNDQYNALLEVDESHFVDLKSSQISPASLTKTVSAFANTSGGEIFVGIEEVEGTEGKQRLWEGFDNQEAANAFFQVLESMSPLGNHYSAEFISSVMVDRIVLHLTIFKTKEILSASNGKIYARRSSQNLPVEGDVAIERLRYDKGINSFEDELTDAPLVEVENSLVMLDFLLGVIPTAEPEGWLNKQ